MKKLLFLVLCLVILGTPAQPAISALANSNVNLSCPAGQRPVFSAPFSISVLVSDRFGAPISGEPVSLMISGPATLDPGTPSVTNNLGILDASILPTPGAAPQPITVRASIQAGVVVSTSCLITSATLRPSDVIARLDGPDSVQSGSSLNLNLYLATRAQVPIPRVPIKWSVVGPGLQFPSANTDSAGSARFQLLLLSGDTGVITVTATANMGSFVQTTTKVIQIGPLALKEPEIEAQIFTDGSFANITVLNAQGSEVSIKFGSRWIRLRATSDVFVHRIESTKAVEQVAVFVNGQLENVTTLSFPGLPKQTATPSPKPAASEPEKRVARSQLKTITCKSGTKWMTVTAIQPKCLAGYKPTTARIPAGVKSVRCSKSGTTLSLIPVQPTCPSGFRKG